MDWRQADHRGLVIIDGCAPAVVGGIGGTRSSRWFEVQPRLKRLLGRIHLEYG
jgi:hypothetical protein